MSVAAQIPHIPQTSPEAVSNWTTADVRAYVNREFQRSYRPDIARKVGATFAALATLVAADQAYDIARRDWERLTDSDPMDFTKEELARIATAYEDALANRQAAMQRAGATA